MPILGTGPDTPFGYPEQRWLAKGQGLSDPVSHIKNVVRFVRIAESLHLSLGNQIGLWAISIPKPFLAFIFRVEAHCVSPAVAVPESIVIRSAITRSGRSQLILDPLRPFPATAQSQWPTAPEQSLTSEWASGLPLTTRRPAGSRIPAPGNWR